MIISSTELQQTFDCVILVLRGTIIIRINNQSVICLPRVAVIKRVQVGLRHVTVFIMTFPANVMPCNVSFGSLLMSTSMGSLVTLSLISKFKPGPDDTLLLGTVTPSKASFCAKLSPRVVTLSVT